MTCGDIDLSCTRCRLSAERLHVVPGSGRCKSGIMFIGEAPGEEEDERGEPFVGRAGKLLDSALSKAGVERKDVYVGNIVKCRPPKNRKPKPDEVSTCSSLYLESEIKAARPRVICALGHTAANYFLPTKERMAERVGQEAEMLIDGLEVRLVIAYHPASCLYQRKNLASFGKSVKRALHLAAIA